MAIKNKINKEALISTSLFPFSKVAYYKFPFHINASKLNFQYHFTSALGASPTKLKVARPVSKSHAKFIAVTNKYGLTFNGYIDTSLLKMEIKITILATKSKY